MTGKNLATIALKVWGVVFVAGALMTIPQMLLFLGGSTGAQQPQALVHLDLMLAILGPLARAIVGVLMILFASRLADATIPETAPLAIDAGVPDLTALAFCVAGVIVLVWGLEDVASIGVTFASRPDWISIASRSDYVWNTRSREVARAIVELVVAAVLIFGRSGLANAWSRLRDRRGAEDAGAD